MDVIQSSPKSQYRYIWTALVKKCVSKKFQTLPNLVTPLFVVRAIGLHLWPNVHLPIKSGQTQIAAPSLQYSTTSWAVLLQIT